MSDSSFSLIAPIDPELGGVLLANMLEAWLDADPSWLTTAEVSDEFEDHRTASEQACLYLCAPVDYGPSTAPSREHGTPVCTAPEGAGIGLDRRCHLHTRRRWLLRSSGFQRWTVVGAQGDDGASGVALSARAPPGR